MILWYSAGAILITWNVLRDPAVDHRMCALGALVPLVVDATVGHLALGHSLLFAVGVLTIVMVATIGRRRLRRRLVFLPFGMLCGLVLSGAWLSTELFLWPLLGTSWPESALLPPWPVVALEELAGLLGWVWIWRHFGLGDRERRDVFVRTGRLRPRAVPP